MQTPELSAHGVGERGKVQAVIVAKLDRLTRSVKDLMVRPYVPRFFREGDSAELKVVVNNAGDKPLSGALTLDIVDPDTKKSRLATFGVKDRERKFTVEPGKSANVSFAMVAPRAVGGYAFEVRAKAGQFSDGELRPVPVLPSRLHLAQSRFVTLRDKAKKTMSFPDLAKNDDPTLVTEKLVVTVDQHGNTSAASIPLALCAAVRDGRVKKGDLLMLEAMGGGFTWGSALVRW